MVLHNEDPQANFSPEDEKIKATFTPVEQGATEILFYVRAKFPFKDMPSLDDLAEARRQIARTIQEKEMTFDIQRITRALQLLNRINTTLSFEECELIFGKSLGSHIWAMYIKNNYQLPLAKFSGNTFEPLAQRILDILNNNHNTSAEE